MNNIGLIWFTNNLRVQDNYVLNTALQNHSTVVAMYCFDIRHYSKDEYGFKKTEKFRANFLIESVKELKDNLNSLGIELFVDYKMSEDFVSEMITKFNIKDVYKQKEWNFEELEIEQSTLTKNPSIQLHRIIDQFLIHPLEVSKHLKTIPNSFTSFRNKVEKKCSINAINTITHHQEKSIKNNTSIPTLKDLGLDQVTQPTFSAFPFKGGETNALKRLEYYLFESKKVSFYKKTRNGLIGTDYSTKFSAWLANGSISARTIYWKLKDYEKTHGKNDSTYWVVFELLWRDFFKYISLTHHNRIFQLKGIQKKTPKIKHNKQLIQNWINGNTTNSFINANMLEFKKTGWMSNRGRQNVASFFSKTLLQDWRIGAAYFESMLLDYDVDVNYGNWMYVAGVGNDSRDRVFNPSLQAERYDKDGKYRRLWLQATLFDEI